MKLVAVTLGQDVSDEVFQLPFEILQRLSSSESGSIAARFMDH